MMVWGVGFSASHLERGVGDGELAGGGGAEERRGLEGHVLRGPLERRRVVRIESPKK